MGERINGAGAPPRIGQGGVVHRVGVDRDRVALVVDDLVIDDHRLGAADEDRRPLVGSQAAAVARAGVAVGVQLDRAVGDPHVGLVDFDGVELVESAGQGGFSAGVGELHVIEASPARRGEDQAAPLAGAGRVDEAVVARVEAAAHPVGVVLERGEHDRIARQAFGDQLAGDLRVDPRSFELDDHTRIDPQPAVEPRRRAERPARRAVNQQVLGDDVDDVRVVPAAGHFELLGDAAELGGNPHEQAVDRVVEHGVAVDIGADPPLGLLEAGQVGGDRAPRAMPDLREGDRRPGADEVDRSVVVFQGADGHLAAAVLDVGPRDPVEKHAVGFVVGIGPEDEAAPVAPRLAGARPVAVAADRVVAERAEMDLFPRRAQHLHGGAVERNPLRRRADLDVRPLEFQDRPGVDHQGHVLGHLQQLAVGQLGADVVVADQVRRVVVRGFDQAISAAVADDAHHVARLGVFQCSVDFVIGRFERTVAAGASGRLVDKQRAIAHAEPEVECAAGQPVGVAVKRRAGGVDQGRGRLGLEGQLQLVRAVGPAAEPGILDRRVDLADPRAHHADIVDAGLDIQLDQGVVAVVVVVLGDDLADERPLDVDLAVEHQLGVQGARRGKPLGHGFERQRAPLLDLELVEIDVVPGRRPDEVQVHEVVVAGIDGFAVAVAVVAHRRRDVVGVAEREGVADLVDRRVEPPPAVFA